MSLKLFKFKRQLDSGAFSEVPEGKFPMVNGDKVWIGEDAPIDPTIEFWMIGPGNIVKTVYVGEKPPEDTTLLWLEV